MKHFMGWTAIVLVAAMCGTTHAQSGSIVQDEHDKRVKADSDRNTKYHNNADDYPKSDTNAIAAAIAAGIKPSTKPASPEAYHMSANEEAEYAQYQTLIAAYRAGDVSAALEYGAWRYQGRGVSADKTQAFKAWNSIADRNVRASFLAGWMLFTGEGTTIDEDRGRRLLESAAAAGDAEARTFLAANPRRAKTVGTFAPMTARTNRVISNLAWYGPNRTDEKDLKLLMELAQGKRKSKLARDYIHAARIYLYGVQVQRDLSLVRPLLNKAEDMHPDTYDWTTLMQSQMVLSFAMHDMDDLRQRMQNYVGGHEPTNTSFVAYLRALLACMDHQPEQQREFLEIAVKRKEMREPNVELALMQFTGEGGPVFEPAGRDNLMAVAPVDGYAAWLVSRFMETGQYGFAKNATESRKWLEVAAKAGQLEAVQALSVSTAK